MLHHPHTFFLPASSPNIRRWFLLGPRRSGTNLHIDPLGTSAWNTLIHGRKRWVLFPPGANKKLVKGKKMVLRGEDDEAIDYFVNMLPRIKVRNQARKEDGLNEPRVSVACSLLCCTLCVCVRRARAEARVCGL